MRISGEWLRGDDGETRAVVRVKVMAVSGEWVPAVFQIDTGADHTVLAAEVIGRLGRLTPPSPRQLGGVGGAVETVSIDTQLQFARDDGVTAVVGASLRGFLDPDALDTSLLGLDVLKNFAIVVDYPDRIVCLLAGRHRYVIEEG